jgi:hypothetical protein
VLLPHRRPQPARPPNGPPFFNFGLVTDAQAADKPDDSGEGQNRKAELVRPLGLSVLSTSGCAGSAGGVRACRYHHSRACFRSEASSMVASVNPRAPPTSAHFKRLLAHGPQELFTWSATVASVQAARCAHYRASPLCVLLPARTCPRLGAPRARHDRAVDARLGRGVCRGGRVSCVSRGRGAQKAAPPPSAAAFAAALASALAPLHLHQPPSNVCVRDTPRATHERARVIFSIFSLLVHRCRRDGRARTRVGAEPR